ncbi:MAG: pirin family protein [Flavobacteriales bacterium]|nr:pirin family protein [Flavobacteriales bacterium]
MKISLFESKKRGQADYGWLKANYSFSFSHWFDSNRMNFGALRVLNDDLVAPGGGFPTHPHNNMEIITIPLKGDLEHKDSMGNTAIIKNGYVQVMSAGTGVTHSEYNKNKDQELNLLQIWVYPKLKNVTPRYDEVSIADIRIPNELYQILSPNPHDQGVWIHQDAWFYLGEFDQQTEQSYELHSNENGVYLFVIEGEITIDNYTAKRRDALSIEDSKHLKFKTSKNTQVLLMEVPMDKKIIV